MISVVLVEPETPENIGFIARAMANFDLKNLVLLDPKCNHLSSNALKTSKHASEILKNAKVKPYDFEKLSKDYNTVIGTTSVLGKDYNIPRTPVPPDKIFEKITDNHNIALVFGREGPGLNNEEIKKCDIITTIPSSSKYPALNISHAAIILFYEIYKNIGENKVDEHITPVSTKEKEVMLGMIDEIIDNLEFSTAEKKQTQIITWKRVFNQAMLSKRESYAVMGLLRKITEELNK